MFSSFQTKDLRPGDHISVQTFTGKHSGKVAGEPHKTQDVYSSYSVPLDCADCASRHGVTLPTHKLVNAERTP